MITLRLFLNQKDQWARWTLLLLWAAKRRKALEPVSASNCPLVTRLSYYLWYFVFFFLGFN